MSELPKIGNRQTISDLRNMNKLVFIRGWASIDYTFAHFLKTKPADWEVKIIAADKLVFDQDLDKAADRLYKIIQKDKPGSFVLAGHSLGGAVALAFSAKYPATHSRVIIINSVGAKIPGSFHSAGVKMLLRNIYKPPSQWLIKGMEAINLMKNPVFHYKLAKFARNVDILAHAKKIKKPVLILFGENDKLVPLETAKAIQNLIEKSTLKVLPGMGHDWISFYPEKFWEILNKH